MPDSVTKTLNIDVIIPARNEESAIGHVISGIPPGYVRHIIVADNGSTDSTARVSREAGAIVVSTDIPGYGNACLSAINYLNTLDESQKPDIVVFLDGDYSDYPEQLPEVTRPVAEGQYDLSIGSRVSGDRERGALAPQQIVGNALATKLIKLIFGQSFTDLGPFRAILWDSLMKLNMQDRTYGWTVEMQIKAAKSGLRCIEVPVSYRKRIGKSKVSGTVKGSIMAGYKILWMIFKLA